MRKLPRSSAARAEEPAKPRSLVGIILGGSLAAAILIECFYLQQEAWVREQQRRALLTIAEIKTAGIAAWRRERIGDARGVPLNAAFARFIRDYLAHPTVAAETEIRNYFEVLKGNHDYSTIALFDALGNVRLSSDVGPIAADQDASLLALEAMRQGRVVFEDFHRSGGSVHLSVVGPMYDEHSRVVGALQLRIDPTRFLYRQIQTWPTPSESGETLLVRRVGDQVLYLNELRHKHGTAVLLRLPVNDPALLAAQTLRGREGFVEGKDYRGIAVIGVVRRIPDSPWFLITKIDRFEAYEGLRARTWYFAAITLLVLVLSVCALLLASSRSESEHYRRHIAERERADREIRRLNAVLEGRVQHRTAQWEAVNKELEAFTYSVSHDLRAPLRSINGWSLALVEDCGSQLDQRGREYLDRVRSEVARMGLLIDDLLELSRVSRAEMEHAAVDLTAVAHTVVARIREAHPSRSIDFDIQTGLTAVGDASLLDIALTNLLDNAAKFTGPRAEPRIEVGQTHHDTERVFYVRDNGVGFDMAHAHTLFGAFQRLHKHGEFPGTGIGLATVKRVIGRHGGRVWAEARLNQGATFYFTLPRTV